MTVSLIRKLNYGTYFIYSCNQNLNKLFKLYVGHMYTIYHIILHIYIIKV